MYRRFHLCIILVLYINADSLLEDWSISFYCNQSYNCTFTYHSTITSGIECPSLGTNHALCRNQFKFAWWSDLDNFLRVLAYGIDENCIIFFTEGFQFDWKLWGKYKHTLLHLNEVRLLYKLGWTYQNLLICFMNEF